MRGSKKHDFFINLKGDRPVIYDKIHFASLVSIYFHRTRTKIYFINLYLSCNTVKISKLLPSFGLIYIYKNMKEGMAPTGHVNFFSVMYFKLYIEAFGGYGSIYVL